MGVRRVLFWGFVVWAIFALVTALRRGEGDSSSDSARRILDERLARRDIDLEMSRQRRAALADRAR